MIHKRTRIERLRRVNRLTLWKEQQKTLYVRQVEYREQEQGLGAASRERLKTRPVSEQMEYNLRYYADLGDDTEA